MYLRLQDPDNDMIRMPFDSTQSSYYHSPSATLSNSCSRNRLFYYVKLKTIEAERFDCTVER